MSVTSLQHRQPGERRGDSFQWMEFCGWLEWNWLQNRVAIKYFSNILEHLTLSLNHEANYCSQLVPNTSFETEEEKRREEKRRLHLFVKIVKPAGWLIIVARCLARGREWKAQQDSLARSWNWLVVRQGCVTPHQHRAGQTGKHATLQLTCTNISLSFYPVLE